MKRENIIGFSAVAITILVLLFFRNYSISRTYTIDEKELTREQALKEMPLLEISEDEYLLRDIILELDMVHKALNSGEEYVLLDTDGIVSDIADNMPSGFELREAFVIDETVGLDFWSEKERIIYEFNGKEQYHKTLAILDKEGQSDLIYTNGNNEEFIKMKKRLDKIEFELNEKETASVNWKQSCFFGWLFPMRQGIFRHLLLSAYGYVRHGFFSGGAFPGKYAVQRAYVQ